MDLPNTLEQRREKVRVSMKRFIRYLYEYRNGKRVQNVGFVKVEMSANAAVIQVYGKGFPVSGRQELEIFLFYLFGKQCVGIPWGVINDLRPMTAYRIEYDAEELDSQELFDSIQGLILCCNTEDGVRYYAAVWDDCLVDVEHMILREDLLREQQEASIPSEESEKTEEIEQTVIEKAQEPQADVVEEESEVHTSQVYKITRKDLVNLPRQEWKLANNNFLVHGCRNFHHLVSFEKDGKCWLGVPGIYHKQEEQAAKAFGFEQFMVPDEGDVVLSDDERAEHGDFGYWCRAVHNVIKR